MAAPCASEFGRERKTKEEAVCEFRRAEESGRRDSTATLTLARWCDLSTTRVFFFQLGEVDDEDMRVENPKLAVLGLGTMGSAIARTALRSEIPFAVWNRGVEATEPFGIAGAEVRMWSEGPSAHAPQLSWLRDFVQRNLCRSAFVWAGLNAAGSKGSPIQLR